MFFLDGAKTFDTLSILDSSSGRVDASSDCDRLRGTNRRVNWWPVTFVRDRQTGNSGVIPGRPRRCICDLDRSIFAIAEFGEKANESTQESEDLPFTNRSRFARDEPLPDVASLALLILRVRFTRSRSV